MSQIEADNIRILLQDRRTVSDPAEYDRIRSATLGQLKSMLQAIGLGETGSQGDAGLQGFQGATGSQGDIGPPGEIGATGSAFDAATYGELYVIDNTGGSAPTSLPSLNTFSKFTRFLNTGVTNGITATDNKLIIGETGIYQVNSTVTVHTPNNNRRFEMMIRTNNVANNNLICGVRINNGGQRRNMSVSGLLSLNPGDELELYLRYSTGTSAAITLTAQHASLHANRIA